MADLGLDIGEVQVIARSERALLCRFDDGKEAWVPLSTIDKESEVGPLRDKGILIVPRWLAERLERVDRCGYTIVRPRGKKTRRSA